MTINDSQEHSPPKVGVYFQDEDINILFCDLLRAQGIETNILSALDAAQTNTRIVTEPIYFPQLSPEQQSRCLVVGNKEALKTVTALSLSRPLTEEKIFSALRQFLK